MIRIAKTTLVVFAIVASTALLSKASDGAETRVVKMDAAEQGLYQLTYLKDGKCDVKVSIYDGENNKLFSEKLSQKKSFTKSYDISSLEKGVYTFEVEDEQGVVTKSVVYTPSVLKASVKKNTEGKAEVVVVGTKMDPVIVNFYDASYNLVYGDYISNDKSFSRVYDLSGG